MNSEILEKQLMTIINTEDVKDIVSSVHGTKYIIDGTLKSPSGNAVQVRTIWIIDAGQNRPRFVTAYPL